MTAAERRFDRLRALGLGVTVNRWAEDDADYVVVLWKDGKPAASGHAPSLDGALVEAERLL